MKTKKKQPSKLHAKKITKKKKIANIKSRPKRTKRSIKKRKNNRLALVNYLVAGIVFLIIMVWLFYPNFLSNLIASSDQDNILGSASISTGKYDVSEDELAMFATLAYEDPYRAQIVNKQWQKNLSLPIASCHQSFLIYYNGATDEEKKQDCLRRDRSATGTTVWNKNSMFTSNDMIGTVKLDPVTGQPLAEENYISSLKSDSKNLLGKLGNNIGKGFQAFMASATTGNQQESENSEKYYFSKIASVDSTPFLKDWSLVDAFDATSIPNWADKYGIMSAQTYKKGKNIVIAFRGTDLTDIYDWLANDVSYATNNDSKQDAAAKNYARTIAEIYNKNNPNPYNIYITGHSLGGYLAQIAASDLIPIDSYANSSNPLNLKRVVYFNGMGLFFTQKSRTQPKNQQITARNRLVAFNTTPTGQIDDKILLVHMFGDPVSSLGYHYGKIKTIKPTTKDGQPFQGITDNYNAQYDNWLESTQSELEKRMPIYWSSLRMKSLNGIATTLGKFAKNSVLPFSFYPNEIPLAVYWFNTRSVLSYFMTVHATDYFFYNDFYYQMSINNDIYSAYKGYYSGTTYVKPFAAPAAGSSISSLPANIESRSNFDVKAYGPLCSLNIVNPSGTINSTTINIKKGQSTSARLICNDSSGFINPASVTASSFVVTSGSVIKKVLITSVSKPLAKRTDENGTVTSYEWTIGIKGNTSSLVSLGETSIYLKEGSVKSSDNRGNDQTMANLSLKLIK